MASDDTRLVLSPEERSDLVEAWRHTAERLDTYARCVRRNGDILEGQLVEQVALDYRIAADDLESFEVAA